MTSSKRVLYWIRIEVVVLVAATAMSVIGTSIWVATLPRPFFKTTDLILPSCLTWALLAPLISRMNLRRAMLVGLVSPFLGSVFVILLRIGPAGGFTTPANATLAGHLGQFLGLLFYAFIYIGVTAWATLPVGAVAGAVVHFLFRLWPHPDQGRHVAAAARWNPVPHSLFARLAFSALPFLPLLGLLIPERPIPPDRIISRWRVLMELYYFPVHFLSAATMRVEVVNQFLHLPGMILSLRLIQSAALSFIVYRALKKRSFRKP